MKTVFGAVAGALALVVALVAYDLGERHSFSRDAAAMSVGFQPGNPYLVQAGQPGYGSPYGSAAFAPCNGLYPAQYPYGPAAMPGYAAPQYVSDRVLTPQPVVRRASTQRTYVTERAPQRSWQKSAMLIGGSAAGGAGVGALIGGKKGAGIGALIGGGAATLYDQAKRH